MSLHSPIELKRLLNRNVNKRDGVQAVLSSRRPVRDRFGRFVRSSSLQLLSTHMSHSVLLKLQHSPSLLTVDHLSDDLGVASQSTSPYTRKAFTPWTLRWTSLVGLIGFVVSLITALELLSRHSKEHQGFAASTNEIEYIWKYCPTASQYEHNQQSNRL